MGQGGGDDSLVLNSDSTPTTSTHSLVASVTYPCGPNRTAREAGNVGDHLG